MSIFINFIHFGQTKERCFLAQVNVRVGLSDLEFARPNATN